MPLKSRGERLRCSTRGQGKAARPRPSTHTLGYTLPRGGRERRQLGAPTRGPTSESIEVRVPFGSRPLPLTQKLLHTHTHTHSRPPSYGKHVPPTRKRARIYTFPHEYASIHGNNKYIQPYSSTHKHRCTQPHVHSKTKQETFPCALELAFTYT